ncbi:hypothetical protein EYD45_07520 [Hyunsoonleella flava]|uniref:Uncharacterized protein n=1 Tax=Hyunsoonleella flava TaxID=2527939 RepID=A0A4Q9FF13_9FLAO|nr:hypothetical protein [Hyunsoonleella flava]TBN04457.1 hypothetical protein EYD45_07520 [Hyunsoonleella flava]
MIDKKLKAGALQFTMYVVVVIALVLGGFIILMYTHKHFKAQHNFTLETIKICDRGILYAMDTPLKQQDTLELDILDKDNASIKIHKESWGVYDKIISISKIKNKVFKKIALAGAVQQETNRVALYLEDNNKPLVVVGDTKIQGVAYLPKHGVRTGNISGHSYYGNALIYGATKTSDELPKLSSTLNSQITTITSIANRIDKIQFLDLDKNRTHQNSFLNPVKVAYSLGDIELFNFKLTGNIVVQSNTKITVDASSQLKDIILIAPEIHVMDGVHGVFQAFATKTISVGKNCRLNYPSALVLKNSEISRTPSKNSGGSSLIQLDKGATVKGVVVFLGGEKNYKPQIRLKNRATIVGEIYCNRNLELLGRVKGTVFTSGFVANQSGSSYQNHIYDGQIIVDNLPEQYVGLSFQNSKKGVAKWLY